MSLRGHIDPRTLDQRVTFDRLYEIRTATGSITPDWRPLVTCWGRVDGARAGEPRAGDQTITERDYTVWIRAEVFVRFSLTAVDRIRWKSMILDIKTMPDQGYRGRMIGAICKAGKNKG